MGLWSIFSTTVPVDFLFQQVFHPFLSKTGFLILLKCKDVRKYLHFLSWLYFFFSFSTLSTIQWYDYIPDGIIWQIQSTVQKYHISSSLMLRTGFWETSQHGMQIILICCECGDSQKEGNCSCRTQTCVAHVFTGEQRVISGLINYGTE